MRRRLFLLRFCWRSPSSAGSRGPGARSITVETGILGPSRPSDPNAQSSSSTARASPGSRRGCGRSPHRPRSAVFTVVDQVDGATGHSGKAPVSSARAVGAVWSRVSPVNRDYRLIVEFRWGLSTWGQRRNAARGQWRAGPRPGFPRQHRRDGNGAWMRSIEAQVIEGGWATSSWSPASRRRRRRLTPRLTAEAREGP